MGDISNRLKEKLLNMTDDERESLYEKYKHYNDIGPNARKYIEKTKNIKIWKRILSKQLS